MKSFQVTQGRPIAVCTLLAEEFGNFCRRSRGSQSLEHPFFLGTERSLVFLVVLGVTALSLGQCPAYMIPLHSPAVGRAPVPSASSASIQTPEESWVHILRFFFSHTNYFFLWKEKMVLPGTRATACPNLCRRVYLKSYLCPLQQACLRHTASLRWQTRLKITCGTSLVQFHVTCLPSPCIDGNKIFVTG